MMKTKIAIDNVVDLKNNISLDQFTRYSYNDIIELTSINPECEIELSKKEELEYIKIRNFLNNPEDLKKFLISFPCEDRMMSMEKDGNTEAVSKAPGFQQIINAYFFKVISQYLHKILEDKKLIHYKWSTSSWEFYTNCIHSGMKSYKKNYTPHLDEFNYAANIFLTDVENTGTSFFKFKGLKNCYYNNKQIMRVPEDMDYYRNIVHTPISDNEIVSEWPMYTGDENFIRYHTIPAEYNCVSMYKGKFWHSIYFDSTVPDNIRYSLVGVLRR